jgi:hypothetical protein
METVDLDMEPTADELMAMGQGIESEWLEGERLARLEAAEHVASVNRRNAVAEARRAEREARRQAAHVAGAVVLEAGDKLNRAGAWGIVATVKADGMAELATTSRSRDGVELAPLARVHGAKATVWPVAPTHLNRVRLWQMERQLSESLAEAEASEIGRDVSEPPTAERSAYERQARRFLQTVGNREPVTEVPASDARVFLAALSDVAGARIRTREHNDRQALKLRTAHRADMAARKDARDERAAATADAMLSTVPRVLDKGQEGALLTAREIGQVLGRALTPAERQAARRARLRAERGTTVKARGTDTAAQRLANSLQRK